MSRAEDGIREGPLAVGKSILLNAHRLQDAQLQVRHPGLAFSVIHSMLQAHVGATGNQRGQIAWLVGGTGSTAIQHNGVIQHRPLGILIAVQTLEKPC